MDELSSALHKLWASVTRFFSALPFPIIVPIVRFILREEKTEVIDTWANMKMLDLTKAISSNAHSAFNLYCQPIKVETVHVVLLYTSCMIVVRVSAKGIRRVGKPMLDGQFSGFQSPSLYNETRVKKVE